MDDFDARTVHRWLASCLPHRGCAPCVVRLVPRALPAGVLQHELDQLIAAADHSRDDVVRTTVFTMSALSARRRLNAAPAEFRRRLIDLREDDRDEDRWTRSTT